MSADLFMFEGRAYSWRQLCELRRQQVEARRAAQGRQLALFELRDDSRPASQRRADGRYAEPILPELFSEAQT